MLTVDETLCCKLMELKWAKNEYQNFLIVRVGGLHVSLNFLKVIVKHVPSSGPLETWVENKILCSSTAEQVLTGKGKSYSKAIRAHKLTSHAGHVENPDAQTPNLHPKRSTRAED